MPAPFPDAAAAQAFQAAQVGYLERGDVPGLLAHCYAPDARLHAFAWRAEGHAAIGQVLTTYLARLAALGARQVEKFATGPDYLWLELRIEQPGQPAPIRVYEVKFVRDGKIYLQLFGLRQGTPWQPGDLAQLPAPPAATEAARAFHQRYLDYHRRGDADGLADDFFSADARLVTGQVDVSGRPAIRQLFTDLFAREADFTPLSVQHLTSDRDYVWFEATVASSLGQRQVYDVMLRPEGGPVSRQLVGQLSGVLPTDAAFGPAPTLLATS
ncbi:nuclear transport factor 2 family protein [Hymenobacter sp. RP-2-7]|uniref:Nuclear transport factor 2 family protein n=1 Tax=Hymenobacter polaris TaxID=2682546 RepID=A0A7Y0ABM4_9BACT|nr:nuclear transport factor 2 family protein [Hymenobacter polaris]NML64404.1 nuclear transport factor 2 family protein [Hymenobacter polaris]